ncbi:MAG: type I restriction endonuclease [Thermodesulfobacteriota bacterium]
MNQTFEQLLTRLSQDQTLLRGVEEATKQGAVLPILSQIGWDCFNTQEVSPEFPVGNGRVDYCLCINKKKFVFLEVKRPTEDLERHEKQLLKYSFTYGVHMAVLTNGLQWWFYLPLVGGNWQQRRFFTIDITQQAPQLAVNHFQEFLGRDVMENGAALKQAKLLKNSREKNKLISQTIPSAWKQLVEEPDELLIELFADRVESICGYRPNLEQLSEYIQESLLKLANDTLPQYPKRPLQIPINKHRFKSRGSRQRGAKFTIEKTDFTAKTVPDIYQQTLKYLFNSNMIDRVKIHIPYATSSVRLLISTDPHHQAGNAFRSPVEYGGYYMEAHKNYEAALSHLEAFLKVCGISMKY